ncbi:hypothetical protein Bbelb_074640 [Branchiostoma belcheri]|nr:hypothetical protein Bbelb_074640 [Branchiostoma belcheri]
MESSTVDSDTPTSTVQTSHQLRDKETDTEDPPCLHFGDRRLYTVQDLQSLRVKDLKDLLKSLGLGISGKKSTLVERAYAHLEGLKSDLSISTAATPAEDARQDADVTSLQQETSHSQWTSDVRQLPEFNFAALYQYLICQTKKYDHVQLSTTSYKKIRAYQFYQEGNVKNIMVAKKHGIVYVKAKVLPSMKQKKYTTIIAFVNSKVQRAACSCPAGTCPDGLGKCNHIGGLLFAIEAFNKTDLRDQPTPVSSTGRLCVWNVPRNDKVEAQQITEVKLGKIRYGKDTKFLKTSHYDPRAPHQREVDNGALGLFRSKVQAHLPDSMFLLYPPSTDSSSSSTPPSADSSSSSTPPSADSSSSSTPPSTDSSSSSTPPSTDSSSSSTPPSTDSSSSSTPPSADSSSSSTPPSMDSSSSSTPPSADSSSSSTPPSTDSSSSSTPPSADSSSSSTPPSMDSSSSSTPPSTDSSSSSTPPNSSLPFNDHYDFSNNTFTEMMDTYMNTTTLTKTEQLIIEQQTRGQSSSPMWMETRKTKLTASNFKAAISCAVEPSNKIRAMLYNSFSTAATEYGNNNEAAAVEEYVNGIQEEFPGAYCEEVGLILSMERPWLGASVDRIVRKDEKTIGGVEVKCPLSKQGMSAEEASQDSKFFLKKVDGSVSLKTTHKYHDQVQGQLYCCELDWVDFVVFFGPGRIFCERIYVSREWQQRNLPKLDHFYRTAVLPELLTRRVKRGQKLYGMYNTGPWKQYH